MEEGESLLESGRRERGGGGDGDGDDVSALSSGWKTLKEETKRMGYIAGPMVAVNLSQYFLQIVSVMMVGHLGELSLSSTAIAISFCAVTGFSPFGMSSALETICGQAYGAEQYQKFSIQIHNGILCLILVCLPLSLVWIFMGKLLVLMGQDPEISLEAGRFATCLIPALFAYGTLQPLVRYFQTQSLVFPLLVSSVVTLIFHLAVCWTLVFNSSFRNLGAAIAIGLSYWLNVILLALYMKYSPSCAKTKTRVLIFRELFPGMREFFSLAVPSAVMICLEWWSFEFLTMLSGLLPNPKLETSVLSVCLAVLATLYTIPDGLGAAVRRRESTGRPSLCYSRHADYSVGGCWDKHNPVHHPPLIRLHIQRRGRGGPLC
ncbi:hypothetical protein BT93_B2538 [Corymbia citriodora subsp. variegata]|nr:hypothetical protein BT93_B2538 [Corymbia citriodora subsp. variegata]